MVLILQNACVEFNAKFYGVAADKS